MFPTIFALGQEWRTTAHTRSTGATPRRRWPNPHEVTLVEAILDEIVTVGRPERIIGDRAYDSDPLDKRLAAKGMN